MNIVEYAQTMMDDFAARDFSDVDSLVLSQLAYLQLHGVVPGLDDLQASVRIADLLKAELIPDLLHNVRDPEENHQLLLAVGMSPRFRDLRMCGFTDHFDQKEQKQFAAVTFLLNEQNAYVAYRGTDTTLVGWKEDFNMAFISPVPSQLEGVSYLNAVAAGRPHQLMVGGHSKGGNIAVYSAMACKPDHQERISLIFSHDGPGFREEVLKSSNYDRIKSRIHKTLPQFSLVGMLLQQQENYHVVKSSESGIMQHDPFSWVINREGFQYLVGITDGAEHIDTVINQWLVTLDDQKRERFISALFQVFESTGIVNFSDFTEERHKKAIIAMENIREIDAETKRFVFDTLKSLLALYLKNLSRPLWGNKTEKDSVQNAVKTGPGLG